MEIVINALPYKNNGSGISVNLRELFGPFTELCSLPCRIVVPRNSPPFPHGGASTLTEAPCAYGQGIRRLLYQSFVLGPRYCSGALLFTMDSKIPLLLPQSCRVVPLVTDLAVFRMSEAYQKSRVMLWKTQYRWLCRRASRFLAISEFTKKELTALLSVPPEAVTVIPCACSERLRRVSDAAALRAFRQKYALPEHYILFVGSFNPRKNLERLIAAFDRLKRETPLTHELVIAGEQGWKFDREAALRGVSCARHIRFIGYVPDEEMAALYSAAELFVFPSLYEGFGIPVLEAQRCGTPVLTANVSALPEVGGAGAIYVDPLDVEDIARGMERALADAQLRERLICAGLDNVKRFSWRASAEKLRDFVLSSEAAACPGREAG